MPQIMALIDGSVYAQSVCDHAAWIAKRGEATVKLVHALGRRHGPTKQTDLSGSIGIGARSVLLDELAAHDAQTAKLAQKRGRAILEDAKARVEAAGAHDVTTQMRHGDVVESVQELQDEADLIIIGKRGEAEGFAKKHLGSNMERVVRSTHKPVLVSSRSFTPIKNFMIAYDGGASAQKAIEHVANAKTLKGLACHLLTIGADSAANQQKLQAATTILQEAGLEVSAQIIDGQPEEVIVKKIAADDINLLMMGAYGHSRIRNLVIGSTTTAMVSACKIPVLLFR